MAIINKKIQQGGGGEGRRKRRKRSNSNRAGLPENPQVNKAGQWPPIITELANKFEKN